MHHQLAILAIDLGVDERVLGDFVKVIGIVRGVLETPLDLAVARADGEHARGPFVVARPVFGVEVRAGISDALVERVRVRIVGRGLPDRAAAMPPALLAVLPGLATWLPGTGDRVGAPSSLAGVEVGGLDEAANAVFAAGGADNGEIANDQRRNGQRLTQSGIDDLALPHDLAGRLVDGEHSPVQRDRDHLVLPQRNAAVIDAAAGDVTRPSPIGTGIHFPFDDAFLAAGDVDGID